MARCAAATMCPGCNPICPDCNPMCSPFIVKRTKVFVAEAGHLVRVRVGVRVRVKMIRVRVRVRVKRTKVFVAEAGHQRGARLASRSGCGMPVTVCSRGCNRAVTV